MTAFRFRLDRVLRLRTQLRQLVQDEVALLGTSLARVRAQADAVRDEERVARTAAEAEAQAGVTGEDVRRSAAWERTLQGRAATLADEAARVAEAIVQRREELLARRREERKLERLEERARGRFQVETARQEALVLDDLALRPRRNGEER